MPINFGLLNPSPILSQGLGLPTQIQNSAGAQSILNSSPMNIQMPQQPLPQAQPASGHTDGGFGGALSSLGSFLGKTTSQNPVAKTNAALSQTLSQTSPKQISQNVLPQLGINPTPSKSQPINIPNSSILPNVTSNIIKSFPNDSTRQRLALAQASLESNLIDKPSQLATKYNNLFGVSGKGPAGSVMLPTKEHINGRDKTVTRPFAIYNSQQQSIDEYKKLITTSPKYVNVMKARNFTDAAQAIQASGYATDPHYAQHLQSTMHNLEQVAYKAPPQNIKGGIPVPKDYASTPAFQGASQAYQKMLAAGKTKSPIVTIVDFSQPATAKRLSVINMQTGKVLMQSEVAQGAPGFSNTPNSHQSSLGTFQTTTTFSGKHGYSLKIKGLDKGVNDNAASRNIEFHSAAYIGNGKTGRSFGCFAVPQTVSAHLINLIKDGTTVYSYGGGESAQKIPNPTPVAGIRN